MLFFFLSGDFGPNLIYRFKIGVLLKKYFDNYVNKIGFVYDPI